MSIACLAIQEAVSSFPEAPSAGPSWADKQERALAVPCLACLSSTLALRCLARLSSAFCKKSLNNNKPTNIYRALLSGAAGHWGIKR